MNGIAAHFSMLCHGQSAAAGQHQASQGESL
jgi:hypothetical protein